MHRYIADMHTHSEFSHDSECKIEDMCLAQIANGTQIFAVTDHCDIDRLNINDNFIDIKKSCQQAKELNEKYGDKCMILSGVEVGELFWHPEYTQTLYELYPYDVIIGSVHRVKHKYTGGAYSLIDFSRYTLDDIYDFLDKYFNDVVRLLDTTDFDILAHLTCPLRYIVGKYKHNVDMTRYVQIIGEILQTIIDNGIALEVNTSTYSAMGEFLPHSAIIKRYYDMGGRLVTLGSDAHISHNASQHFDKAITLLKQIGFEGIYYYKDRKPIKISI